MILIGSSRQLKTKRCALKPFSPKLYNMAAPWSNVTSPRLNMPHAPGVIAFFNDSYS